ncbi:MAG: EpsG family protein [Polaromonas sp.]
MWPYWLLFLLPAFRSLSSLKPISPNSLNVDRARWPGWWWVIFGMLVLMIGLRHEVGGDWGNYLRILNTATGVSLKEALSQSDPAYSFLNWVAAKSGLGVYLVNSVCATFFAWGLVVFCRTQPRPWLAMVVAVPYLVTVVAMGYSRQGVAIGVAMLGLVALGQGQVLRFMLWLVLAAMFHKSALILMPLAVLAGTKRRIFTLFWVAVAASLLFVLLLQESVEGLSRSYVEAQLESSGAAIRVAMNALPAAVFLLLRKRFQLAPAQRSFWTWMALGALAFVVLLELSPSSTAVDRVALYWIPLQMFVWSRLPDALSQRSSKKTKWVFAVIAYSASVLFVWMSFGAHATAWLPYQFYPLMLLWG